MEKVEKSKKILHTPRKLLFLDTYVMWKNTHGTHRSKNSKGNQIDNKDPWRHLESIGAHGKPVGVPPHYLHVGVALRLVLLLGTHTLRALMCKHEPLDQCDYISQGFVPHMYHYIDYPNSCVLLFSVTQCNNVLLMSSVYINESSISCLDFI